MIKSFKITLLFYSIFLFIFLFALSRCIFILFPKIRPRLSSYLIHIFSKFAIFIIGIRVKTNASLKSAHKNGVFFVTNHVSYLDGIVASSIFPLVFIGRGDLRNWPLFGIFTLLSDTIFVNRLSSSNLHNEIQKMSFFLQNKVNLILFPEGTTGGGNCVGSFKSSFFEAPIQAQSLIIPFVVKYTKINGQEVNDKNKDLIFWYGDMEFIPHLFGVLGLRNIEAEVKVLKPIDGATVEDRKQLSAFSREVIVENLEV